MSSTIRTPFTRSSQGTSRMKAQQAAEQVAMTAQKKPSFTVNKNKMLALDLKTLNYYMKPDDKDVKVAKKPSKMNIDLKKVTLVNKIADKVVEKKVNVKEFDFDSTIPLEERMLDFIDETTNKGAKLANKNSEWQSKRSN